MSRLSLPFFFLNVFIVFDRRCSTAQLNIAHIHGDSCRSIKMLLFFIADGRIKWGSVLTTQAIFSSAHKVIKRHRHVTFRFQLLTPRFVHIHGSQFQIGSGVFYKRHFALVKREFLYPWKEKGMKWNSLRQQHNSISGLLIHNTVLI